MKTIDQLLGNKEQAQPIEEMATRKDFAMMADVISNIEDPFVRKQMAEKTAEAFAQGNPRFNADIYFKECRVADDAKKPGNTLARRDAPGEGWGAISPARESMVSKLLGQKVEEVSQVNSPQIQKLISEIRFARKTGDKTGEMNAKHQLVRLVPNWKGVPEIVGVLGESIEEGLEVGDVVHMICGAAGDDKECLKKGLHALSKGQLKKVYNAIVGKDTLKDEEEGEKAEKADKPEEKSNPFASSEENKSEKEEAKEKKEEKKEDKKDEKKD